MGVGAVVGGVGLCDGSGVGDRDGEWVGDEESDESEEEEEEPSYDGKVHCSEEDKEKGGRPETPMDIIYSEQKPDPLATLDFPATLYEGPPRGDEYDPANAAKKSARRMDNKQVASTAPLRPPTEA